MINLQGATPSTPAPVDVSEVMPTPSVNVADAQEVTPPEAPVQMAPLSQAGVNLVKWLLTMIFIFVAISLIWIWISESQYSAWLEHPHATGNPATDLIKGEEAGFREFWMKIFQMVLLNVLLPVLTAILGYTFGSSQAPKS